MLTFAVITPHPPIIVPGIGKPEDLKKANKTILAMDKLADKIAEEKPDIIIIISPHTLIHHDRFAVYGSPKFYGDFEHFGETKTSIRFENNLQLASEIVKKSNIAGINAFLFGDPDNDYFELDHGEMVPLYYLTKKLPEDIQIIPIAYSHLDRAQHYGFGQIIKEVSDSPLFKNKKIALIASGDLSHRLVQNTQAGYSESGHSFDNQLVEFIKYNKVREIVEMDEELVEDSGQCGYKSILILLGALDNIKYTPEVLSYEAPFGVGYLVANFEINSD